MSNDFKPGDKVQFVGKEQWHSIGKIRNTTGEVLEEINPPAGRMFRVRFVIPAGHIHHGTFGGECYWKEEGSAVEHVFPHEIKKVM